jgi:hypothetical protein
LEDEEQGGNEGLLALMGSSLNNESDGLGEDHRDENDPQAKINAMVKNLHDLEKKASEHRVDPEVIPSEGQVFQDELLTIKARNFCV